MKVVYFTTSGANDPTRASIPIHLAVNGSLEVGHETSLILAGDATDIVLDGNAATLEGVGIPPMRELIAKLKEHSVPVYV